MLKKIYRLPAKQKFQKPSFSKTPIFTLRISSNNLSHNRFGFVVKKTTDKHAVVRNRSKRVLRSCIEEMFENIKEGHDMLFSLEKGIIGKERKEIFTDLKKLLSEKNLLT